MSYYTATPLRPRRFAAGLLTLLVLAVALEIAMIGVVAAVAVPAHAGPNDPYPFNWGRAAGMHAIYEYWASHHESPMPISSEVAFCKPLLAQNKDVQQAKTLPSYAWPANGDDLWLAGCELGVVQMAAVGRAEVGR